MGMRAGQENIGSRSWHTDLTVLGRINLVPRAISAFKMVGGHEEDPGEQQVMCLQKCWRF